MPELYHDHLHDRHIISSPERAARPFDPSLVRYAASSPVPTVTYDLACPFCLGNESETPPELLAARPANQPSNSPTWTSRLVPNRFPAVANELGQHDVLICCAEHHRQASSINDAQWHESLQLAQQRLRTWRDERRWRWATLFQNNGALAGASLSHLHCQLVALPNLPSVPNLELVHGEEIYRDRAACYWCSEIVSAARDVSRLVCENDRFAAHCPAASRLPYETWILPKRHNSHFEFASEEDLADLANLLRCVLMKMETLLPGVAYNWWLHTAPFDSSLLVHYHWHIEIVPRVATMAGFEWCSGWNINSVPAEVAAQQLHKS